MKTLGRITKKTSLITGIALGALILATTFVNAATKGIMTDDKITEAKKVAALEAEVLVLMEAGDNLLAEFNVLNPPTVKIFDANNELIYEGVVDNKEITDNKKIITLLHRSDFLMKFENTSYYKLHN